MVIMVDPNVEEVCALLRKRSLVGIAEYGQTTDRLSLERSLVELRDELLDGAVYITQALRGLR